MKRKTKIPLQKELENNFSLWRSAGPEAIKRVKDRNAALKLEKEGKDGKINMRLPSSDIKALKALAENKGIPYQTFLGMIIHQYIRGTLVDTEEVKKVMKIG